MRAKVGDRFGGAIGLMACSATALLLGLAPAAAVEPRPAPLAGEIVTVAGDESLRFDTEPQWRIAEATQGLKAGDALKTGPNGALALRFADQTMVRMQRNSALVVKAIPAGGTADLELQSGRIWARAATGGTGVEVETPAATAAIRGTDWSLEILPDGRTQLTVMAGVVELRNPQGSVKVGAGEAAIAAIGQAPSKIFLTHAPGREQFLYAVAARDVFSSIQPILGHADGSLGKTVRARRAALAAIPAARRSAEERVEFAEIAFSFEGAVPGVAAIKEARAAGPLTDEQAARLQLLEALLAGRAQHWPEAESRLSGIAKALTGERRYFAEYCLAITELLNHQPEQASATIAHLKTYPPSAVSAMAEARLLALAGDIDAAYRLATESPAIADHVDLQLIAAQLAILRSDEPAARRWVEVALAEDPDNPDTLRVLAVMQSDYDSNSRAAVKTLRRALKEAPGEAELWNVLGLSLNDEGDAVGSEDAFRRAIALDPEDPVPHANYAILLLDNEKVDAAEAEADRALALDPAFYAGLLAKGRVALQRGDNDAAREHFLNAVAANPLASVSTLGLAISYYEAGDLKRAQQSLDAAERLDPNDPIVPLVATVIALDHAEADAAIVNARKAYRRFKAAGGVYNPLAATQSGGSYMSAAFSELGLNDWSRFYGDQLFSPFDAGSQFYQANAAREPVVANALVPATSESFPALTQGLLVDPLSVSSRNRYTDLFRRPFNDFEASGAATLDDNGVLGWGAGGTAQGFRNGALPFSYLVGYGRSRSDNDAISTLSDLDSATLFLGAQPSLSNRLLAWGQYNRVRDKIAPQAVVDLEQDKQRSSVWQTGLGISHSFGARNALNAVVAYQHNNVGAETVNELGAGVLFGNALANTTDAVFAGLSYNVDFGGPVLRLGVEGQRNDSGTETRQSLVAGGATAVELVGHDDATPLQGNAYADVKLPLGAQWTLEGGLVVAHVEDGAEINATRLQPRAGIAFSPFDGQWLRLGYREDSAQNFITSLAPIGVVGLTQADTPLATGGKTRSAILRWDAEWTERLYTFVEYEHQEITDFQVSFTDSLGSISADKGRLDRVTAGANAWLGGGFGVFGRASAYRSRITDGEGDGQRLPTVPDWLASAGVTWEHPAQVRLSLVETVIGERRGGIGGSELGVAPVTNFSAEWQPWDKRIDLTLDASNIFNESFSLADGIPAPGRTMILGAKLRF
jgi:Tfp pilus assembly protein PilF